MDRQQALHPQSTLWLLASSHRTLCIICGLLVLRLVFLLISPLDLISDEAYYWDWGRRLDWCYFSKPPMIAWLMRLVTELTGGSEFALRTTALVLATICVYFIYDLARMMFGATTGLLAALLLMLTPGHLAQSALLTIDAPFLCCFCGTLWATWRWSLKPGVNKNLVLMVLMLLAGILSKQTMLGFIPLFLLYLCIVPSLRNQLFSCSTLAVIVTAIIGIIPLFIWNSHHDWVTFKHTATHFSAEHAATGSFSLGRHFVFFAEFQASQFLLLAPGVWIGIFLTFLATLRNYRTLSQQEIFLCCFSLIPLTGIAVLSMRQRLEPNWGAAFYPAAILLLAGVLYGKTSLNQQLNFSLNYQKWTLNTGLFVTCMCYLSVLTLSYTPLAGTSVDFTSRLKGWQQFALDVEQILPSKAENGEMKYISTTGRSVISELAYYLPQRPVIEHYSLSKNPDSQYDIWGITDESYEKPAIIITPVHKPMHAELANKYQQITLLGTVTQHSGPKHEQRVSFWLAEPKTRHSNPADSQQTAEAIIKHERRITLSENSLAAPLRE